MHREEECGCGEHGKHHREHHQIRHEGHNGDCGCGHHQHNSGMSFHRHFISRGEIIARLEEYLKQLQAEAKGVEERILEMKKNGGY